MVAQTTIQTYKLMSKRELAAECARLEEYQHKYASKGLVVMASSYAGKLVAATLELSTRG